MKNYKDFINTFFLIIGSTMNKSGIENHNQRIFFLEKLKTKVIKLDNHDMSGLNV